MDQVQQISLAPLFYWNSNIFSIIPDFRTNYLMVFLEETTQGWNTPKYSFNRRFYTKLSTDQQAYLLFDFCRDNFPYLMFCALFYYFPHKEIWQVAGSHLICCLTLPLASVSDMAVTGASCVNWSAKEVEEDQQKNFQRVGRGHFDESTHLTVYPGRELIVLYSCFSRVIKPTEKEQKTRCAYRWHWWSAWTPRARNCFSREYGSGMIARTMLALGLNEVVRLLH